MLKTAICDLFAIKYPILQGGMAHVATAELASAVSNAGGLGIIGSGNAEPAWVREQIRLTRTLTDKPFGVNILLISPFAAAVMEVAIEEKVAVLTTGAGNPGTYVPRLKAAGIKVVPVVASVALAIRLERIGVDAVIAEGTESGGEVGETTTLVLVPQVADKLQIPVIAAGGIADGRGLAAALALGAQGVQIGTRFVCSTECIAHPKYKEKILKAHDRTTVVTGRSTGYAMRCLQNKLTRRFAEMEQAGVPKEELELYGRGRVHLGLIDGDIDEGSLLSGQIAGLIADIKPVSTIIEEIVTEALASISQLNKLYGEGPK